MKLAEVAKIAGVSPATVSRALNHPELVNKDTLEKIKKVIKEFDYMPNPAAQALMTGKTKLVGLIVPNLQNAFIAQLVLGVEDQLMRHGYTALICNSHESTEKEKYILRTFLQRRVDGIICAYPHDVFIKNLKHPTVLIGPQKMYPRGNYDCVEIDDEAVASISVQRLYNKGHRKIAAITGNENFAISLVRLECLKRELQSLGLHLPPEYIARGSYDSIDSGSKAMETLLGLKNRPSAVIAFNDMLAIGALKKLADHNIKVPEEMAVIGADDIPFARHFSPALTTIHAPGFDLGQAAAKLLVSRLENPEQTRQHIVIPVSLVARNTD
ncbi:MAG: LacI family DNA-binding transcriptional regulator [Zhaonellaceae bacterium]|nr:LacI family transcriptional regulator [Clostridia bacterium]